MKNEIKGARVKKCQIDATAKYNKKTYDQTIIRTKKGVKQYWQSNLKGESLTSFIITAVNEKIKNS